MANIRTKKIDGVVQKQDALENVLSKKGVAGQSKTGSNRYVGKHLLTYRQIRDMYESGGIGATIISRVADDMTAEGFQLKNIPNPEKLIKEFQKLEGPQKFNEAFRWARAYGGSVILLDVNDGKALDKPLNLEKINSIDALEVYEAGNSDRVVEHQYYSDSRQANYGRVELYKINPEFGGIPMIVHESRIIRLKGRSVDRETRRTLRGWDGSELQPVYESLLQLFSTMASGEQVLDEMVIGTLKMENLDALCSTPEGEALVRKRIDLVDTSKSNENSLVISSNEEYERHTVNLSGMDKIQQNTMLMVSGAAQMPATHIFGRSPQGENATGESDEKQYNSKIASAQTSNYEPGLMKLFNIMVQATNVEYKEDISQIEIEFNPLTSNSLFDVARAFDHASAAWKKLVEAQIFTPDEAKEYIESKNMGLDLIKNVRT